MTTDCSVMAISAVNLTRRGLVLTLGAAVLAPRAIAAPALSFPMRIGYARIGPDGFVTVRADEQVYWTAMQTRTGELIEEIQPIQPSDILGGKAPEVDGGANCAMVARQLASTWGFSHVILYATQDGQRTYHHGGSWVSRAFASLRADTDTDGRATGEAHLLDIGGGAAIASISADAPPRNPLNWFDHQRNPERETLAMLTEGMERRLQSIARPAYEAQRSIAG